MRHIKFLFVFALVLIVAGFGFSQISTDNQSPVFKASDLVQKPTGFIDKLIDPAKFKMSQSYTFSVGSFGKKSYSQGLYLNQMSYQLAKPLSVQLGIGMLHQPFGTSLKLQDNPNQVFVQNARIQYKPSEKFSVTVDYQSRPNPWGTPYFSQW